MRKLFIAGLLAVCSGAFAQTETSNYRPGVTPEGAVYFLAKTVLRFVVRVEKTTYTPGDFCRYAQRYLRLNDVEAEASTTHKLIGMTMGTYGEADKAKGYAVKFNAKTSACNISLADDGTLLAVNATARKPEAPVPFAPAPKPAPVNPRQYLSEEVLAAGSTAKMAELTAQDIYDIRDSKNYLNRGEADYMPKDGEQLRIMLANLDRQERALTEMFTGTTDREDRLFTFRIEPEDGTDNKVVARFSRLLGILSPDNLTGEPLYISVSATAPVPPAPADDKKKKPKGVIYNIPGKGKVAVTWQGKTLFSGELPVTQFGYTEVLTDGLFDKKVNTRVIFNPETGGIAKIDKD